MISNEAKNQQTSPKLVKLPYSIIKIEGPDAEKFLQGQLSCDLTDLKLNTWTYGTANTPKGRMYWLFAVAKMNDHFLIRVHNEIAAQGLATLAKYKVFFKCDIEKLESYHVYGELYEEQKAPYAVVSAPTNMLEESSDGLRKKATPATLSSDVRTELWTEQELPFTQDERAIEAWFVGDCEAGIPEVYPSTLDTFILQQLNLQALGAVSFSKGCYTGQEIIARMKFLGKLKKKMYLFKVPTGSASSNINGLSAGNGIKNESGRKIGQVVRLHRESKLVTGLAVCDIASIESQKARVFFEDLSGESSDQQAIKLYELHYD